MHLKQLSFESDAEEFFRANRASAIQHQDNLQVKANNNNTTPNHPSNSFSSRAIYNNLLKEMIHSPNQILQGNLLGPDNLKPKKSYGSLGIHIPKEVIQRKIDVLLYTTSQ